jgi:glutathionyl-hydroquinone reductase
MDDTTQTEIAEGMHSTSSLYNNIYKALLKYMTHPSCKDAQIKHLNYIITVKYLRQLFYIQQMTSPVNGGV